MLSSSWLVSVLAVVLALILGGLLIAAADAEVQAAASYFFSRPSDLISAAWTAVSEAYAALFAGAIYDPRAETFARAIRPLTETLTVATPLILAGLGLGIGFRAGLFNIGAQGQIILGGIFAGFIGFTFDLPVPAAPAALRPRRRARWRAVGGHRRCAQGAHGCARGHRHDHAQQHRDLPGRVPAEPRRVPAPGQQQPGEPAHPRQRLVPVAARRGVPPARRLPGRPRRRGVHLVADGALDHRLPVPRRRVQPARRAHRGHLGERHLRVGHAHRRCVRRPRRLRAGARHGARPHRRGRGELRVRRHHGRPARSLQAAGHGLRGHPVRRPARRRRRHAGPHRDAHRHRARRAVPHRPVHRGPAAGPVGVPAAVTGHATRPEAGRPVAAQEVSA